ncbi:MAG: metal ABC transporter substrate-binding protein [Oscillospiraceae bacterium]|nr:metal ABC transporter substrate-binding protein [Oscillospiraceae bacterium]
MKKILAALLAALLPMLALTACGASGGDGAQETDTLQIVATIFPEYDWVLELLGDNPAGAEVTLLLDSGVDLHSFQPTADDIIKISTCDLFIYVGGESDTWAEDTLAEASNEDMVVVNLLEALGDGVKEEETVEGMEAEEEDEEETEYDEHVWLSLKNAQTLCRYLSGRLCEIDPAHSAAYQENTEAYVERLDALDGEYQSAVSAAAGDTLLFADRFPFRYLCDDYGLNYYAAFSGCSAETEASFETIAFLAGKVDELGLTGVLTIDGSDQKVAQTILSTAQTESAQILTLNSMQSATLEDAAAGASYLSIMEDNLEVLVQALDY